ncbi:hypothetical protein AGMMS50293_28440 [Spirochaetia bacterium]|nr:hypothetical protein AGMMS50293_28440 [Spirochaetia bacterium]
MTYIKEQRDRAIKSRNEIFNDPGFGIYNGIKWPFVLKNRPFNLWEEIREDAISYFNKYNIDWHKDRNGEPKEGPEGHLLSSNISCINHLFPLRKRQNLSTFVLQNIDDRIISAEIVDDGYVEFEIMEGKNSNPLNEKSSSRKRGSKSTSIDALMLGKKKNGNNILVLIEWKYTETYENEECRYIAKDDYHKNYVDLLQEKDCPITLPSDFKELFFEPYYQLMRQTLLGWKMIELSEYGCDEYIHLHIIPSGNTTLRQNINEPLNWKDLLKDSNSYKIISPDELFKPLIDKEELNPYIDYLKMRYW